MDARRELLHQKESIQARVRVNQVKADLGRCLNAVGRIILELIEASDGPLQTDIETMRQLALGDGAGEQDDRVTRLSADDQECLCRIMLHPEPALNLTELFPLRHTALLLLVAAKLDVPRASAALMLPPKLVERIANELATATVLEWNKLLLEHHLVNAIDYLITLLRPEHLPEAPGEAQMPASTSRGQIRFEKGTLHIDGRPAPKLYPQHCIMVGLLIRNAGVPVPHGEFLDAGIRDVPQTKYRLVRKVPALRKHIVATRGFLMLKAT